mgnify:CR=1 FL=1
MSKIKHDSFQKFCRFAKTYYNQLQPGGLTQHLVSYGESIALLPNTVTAAEIYRAAYEKMILNGKTIEL